MDEAKIPSFNQALVCFSGIITMIVTGVLAFGINIHVLLLSSIIWTCCHTYFLGYKFSDIKYLMSEGVSSGLGATYVFILIGIVIAAFLEGGTIASIVYYSLDLIHPAVFLPSGLLLCAFMSMAVGTLMGTVGTIGVILIGVGAAMNIPLPIVAGMIISGASFGDKMSPMSDTTNIAAISVGTDLYKHIKAMFYTSGPTLIICLVIYTFIGFQYSGQALSTVQILEFQKAIDANFNVSIIGFLPIIILFGLSLNRVPAEPAMLAGAISAILLAIFQQDRNLLDIFKSLQDGYVQDTGHAGLDLLVNRGGIQSMMRTFSLALFALALGGLLEKGGFLKSLLEGILKHVKSVFSLLIATMFSGLLGSLSTGQSYIAIVLTAQLFKDKYKEMGLQKYMLSRTAEESSTLTTPLLPWSLGGAFYGATLGVEVLDYAPWAFLNYLNMVVALILAYFGYGIFRLSDDKTVR